MPDTNLPTNATSFIESTNPSELIISHAITSSTSASSGIAENLSAQMHRRASGSNIASDAAYGLGVVLNQAARGIRKLLQSTSQTTAIEGTPYDDLLNIANGLATFNRSTNVVFNNNGTIVVQTLGGKDIVNATGYTPPTFPMPVINGTTNPDNIPANISAILTNADNDQVLAKATGNLYIHSGNQTDNVTIYSNPDNTQPLTLIVNVGEGGNEAVNYIGRTPNAKIINFITPDTNSTKTINGYHPDDVIGFNMFNITNPATQLAFSQQGPDTHINVAGQTVLLSNVSLNQLNTSNIIGNWTAGTQWNIAIPAPSSSTGISSSSSSIAEPGSPSVGTSSSISNYSESSSPSSSSSSNSSSNSLPPVSTDKSSNNTALIAGITTGVGIFIIGTITALCCYRDRIKDYFAKDEQPGAPGNTPGYAGNIGGNVHIGEPHHIIINNEFDTSVEGHVNATGKTAHQEEGSVHGAWTAAHPRRDVQMTQLNQASSNYRA